MAQEELVAFCSLMQGNLLYSSFNQALRSSLARSLPQQQTISATFPCKKLSEAEPVEKVQRKHRGIIKIRQQGRSRGRKRLQKPKQVWWAMSSEQWGKFIHFCNFIRQKKRDVKITQTFNTLIVSYHLALSFSFLFFRNFLVKILNRTPFQSLKYQFFQSNLVFQLVPKQWLNQLS